MKAIFMTEVGGRLMEIERREIQEKPFYYRILREEIKLVFDVSDKTPMDTVKMERWICVSKPYDMKRDFAVFLLDGIE